MCFQTLKNANDVVSLVFKHPAEYHDTRILHRGEYMKRSTYRLCIISFLLAVAAVIWFFHLFIQVDESIVYINWDSSVHITETGEEQNYSYDTYSNDTDISGTYRFIGTIPESFDEGSLLFETTGLDITVSLNGREIWYSEVSPTSEDSYLMSQASIPLTTDDYGELIVTCTVTDSTSVMFPPFVRFVPDTLEYAQFTALANREAIPSGAAALAFLLVFGIFLMSIAQKTIDWSLIPLMLAAAGISCHRLIQSQGYHFLPENVSLLFGRPEIALIIIVLLIIYLIMNRHRHFGKYLGIVTAWSAVAFGSFYLLSYFTDNFFYLTVNVMLSQLIQSSYYDNVVYWLTLWLTLSCSLISVYGVMRTFADQQVEAQGLELKNKMISENYQSLEERMSETAAIRHEMRHQLTALDILCQNDDFEGIKKMLSEMLAEQKVQTALHFTSNVPINTILQYTSGRAKHMQIQFQASAEVPNEINIPEADLCSLLMNMLDNALEASEKVFPKENRKVSVRIRVSDLYLTIRCENTFNGELKKDKKGNLLTTKEDQSAHGFGCRQMTEIAAKYKSTIYFHTEENSVFIAETALRIPE